MLRYTPEDHEDHPFLKGALVKLRDVVAQVEKEKKQRDMTEQLFKIQSYFGHKEVSIWENTSYANQSKNHICRIWSNRDRENFWNKGW